MATLVGVKALYDDGVTELPSKYIKPLNLRPQPVSSASEDIPLIDLSQLRNGKERKQVINDIAEAAKSWGFFQVMNHGVSSAVMSSMMSAGQDFFNLPLEDKQKYYSEDLKKKMRYGTSFMPSVEQYLEWQDHLHHFFPPFGEDHPWPEKPASYRPAAQEYIRQVVALGMDIMSALSEGLGLEPDNIQKKFGKEIEVSMRVNYYPPCPEPDLALGLSAHTDFGGFTILMQDETGGLQIRRDGNWYNLKPLPDVFVVNIANQLQTLSNGKYKSAKHRAVVNSDKTRMSIATFFEPSSDAVIAPVPELLADGSKPAFGESLYSDFLAEHWTTYLGFDFDE